MSEAPPLFRDCNLQIVRMIQTQMDRLEWLLEADGTYSAENTAELTKLARALKDATQEGRALEKEDRGRVDNLSIEERIDLVREFYDRLSPEKQQLLLETLKS